MVVEGAGEVDVVDVAGENAAIITKAVFVWMFLEAGEKIMYNTQRIRFSSHEDEMNHTANRFEKKMALRPFGRGPQNISGSSRLWS